MYQLNPTKYRLERALLEVTDFYRGMVIDMAEQELGASENWKFLRARLLKAFGDRGLSGRIREVLNVELGVEGDSNEI